MKVKEILTDVATYLNMPDLLETTLFDGSKTATDEQKNIIDFLIKCCIYGMNVVNYGWKWRKVEDVCR